MDERYSHTLPRKRDIFYLRMELELEQALEPRDCEQAASEDQVGWLPAALRRGVRGICNSGRSVGSHRQAVVRSGGRAYYHKSVYTHMPLSQMDSFLKE